MNVLFLSYYFPPMGGVGVRRLLSNLRVLPQYGVNPFVLTSQCTTHSIMDEKPLDEEYLKKIPIFRVGGMQLNSLVEKRNSSIKFGLADYYLALRSLHRMDIYSSWSHPIIECAEKIAVEHNIDLIYSTSPPHSTHLLAKSLSEKTNIPWIMELRDSMTEWPLRGNSLVEKLQSFAEAYYEEKLYKSASAVIFVTHSQQKHALERAPKLVSTPNYVIRNGFDKKYLNPSETHTRKNKENIKLVYTGSLADFNVSSLCTGIKLYCEKKPKQHKITLLIAGTIDTTNKEKLDELSSTIKIQYLGQISHEKSIELQRTADILLLLQTANNKNRGNEILTGKVFEYIAARKPILAITHDGELKDLVVKNKFGISASPTSGTSVSAAIDNLIATRQELIKNHVNLDRFTREYGSQSTFKVFQTTLSNQL